MSIKGQFDHPLQEAGWAADRAITRATSQVNAALARQAGATSTPLSNNAGTAYGRWGITPWTTFTWKP